MKKKRERERREQSFAKQDANEGSNSIKNKSEMIYFQANGYLKLQPLMFYIERNGLTII